MTFLLSADTIRRLNDALVSAGLATPDARDEILEGIHPGFVASLPQRGSPLDQVQSDLAQMNQVPALDDGQVPLRLWLENAVARLRRSGRAEAALFGNALAELTSSGRATPPPATVPSGSMEVPAIETPLPMTNDQPAVTLFKPYLLDAAFLPSSLTEVTGFFTLDWDFAVPPFESKDGRQLKLDNAVMTCTNIHRVSQHDPQGRTIVTLKAMTRNPDGNTWDLASAIPAIQFVLESFGEKTRVRVVLLERGAGPFVCAVLDRLVSAYPQAERSIKQLVDFLIDYCGIDTNPVGQNRIDGVSRAKVEQGEIPTRENMDYYLGLELLAQRAKAQGWYPEFAALEASLRDNLDEERHYGSTESTRHTRARIIETLNTLALKEAGVSFNDLCRGKEIEPPK